MPSGPNELLPAALSDPSSLTRGQETPYDFPPEDEEEGVDFGRYVAALLRYKWLIVGLGVVGLAAGVGVSRLVKPVYAAQATISIDVTSLNAQSSPIRNAQLLESRAWVDLLRSFYVLDTVVLRRLLFIQTEQVADASQFVNFTLKDEFTTGSFRLLGDVTGERLTLSTRDGSRVQEVAAGDSVGGGLGFTWVAPRLTANQVVNFTVRAPRDAAVRLGEDLIAQLPPENAAFLRLQLRGADAAATAATLNAIADRFVEVATILKREKLTTNSEVLREQLASSYNDLRAAEGALETFRVGTITLPSERGSTQLAPGLTETRDPMRNAFFQLRIDRDALARDRDAITRALRAAPDSGALLLVSLGAIPSVAGATELSASLVALGTRRADARALSVGFSSAHPPLQQLEREIAELERRTIPTQASSLVQSLNQRIGDFDDRIAASSREMQQIPTRAIEQARRERNLEIAQSLYTQLRASYEEAILAERSASPDVRVLDRAVPPTTPVTDQLLVIIAGGLAGGLGLGVLLAILLDRFDRRLRYPDQITHDLGLQILGALPLVRETRDRRPLPEDEAHLIEALRSIRMSLAYAHGTAGAFITTISSPGPGDGKSFVSANLAKSFASSGRRTLLIDGDTRRGHLHRLLGTNRRPGLLDYLSGSASREQIVQSASEWGIDFIPCGTRSSGGPEMLASTKMAQLVMALRTEYAAIIVDSPPLGAGVDPLVLASLTGSLVMVLRTGVTDRELAEARLQDLHRLPIRVLGAVLNDVKPEGIYRYYSYLPGYRAEDEVAVAAEKPKRRSLLGRG